MKKEEENLKTPEQIRAIVGRDITPPLEIQRMMAQQMIKPVVEYIQEYSPDYTEKISQVDQVSRSLKMPKKLPDGTILMGNGLYEKDGVTPIRVFKEQNEKVRDAATSRDLTKNATISQDNIIRIFDFKTGKLKQKITSPSRVHELFFDKDSNLISTTFIDHQKIERTWSLNKEKLKKELQWLTNKEPGQKTFLGLDQARIILDMYQAHEDKKQFELSGQDVSRYLRLPQYVRQTLEFYFGVPKDVTKQ